MVNQFKVNSPQASDQLLKATQNLLFDCAKLSLDDSILLVYEDPKTGWWNHELVGLLEREIGRQGFKIDSLIASAPENQKDSGIVSAINQHSCSIFLARIGDQDRFADPPPGKTIVVCYARDSEMFASNFCTVSFQAMKQLKREVDRLIYSAARIEISCLQGTQLEGVAHQAQTGEPDDVTVLRFPLGIGAPISTSLFSGRVSLTGYLTPTGSRVYEPACVKIDSPTFAIVEQGRILRFEGHEEVVEAIDQHYQNIGRQFDIDPYVVHSWHAGLHPGSTTNLIESDDPDLWSNTVFNHPAYLHFHTCGDYPPGEISWMLKNHRVLLDGIEIWADGMLKPENFKATRRCLEEFPELLPLYQ